MKIKTIVQPIEFVELFDAKVNELITMGWYISNWKQTQVIAHNGAKSDILIARMIKDEPED